MTETTLTVREQTDSDGDTLYAVTLVTYSWSALRQLEDLFDVLMVKVRDESEA